MTNLKGVPLKPPLRRHSLHQWPTTFLTIRAKLVLINGAGQQTKFTANDMNLSIASTTLTRRKLTLVIGIIVFGILMGIREDFATRWQRSLVAATAAVVLTVSVALYRKAP